MTALADHLPESGLRFVAAAGARTRCFDAGQGDTVVLVHGGQFGPGYSLDCWSLILPALTARHRVVAFDRLGQGWTDNPPDADGYTADAVVEHAIAVLDALGIERAHLVGHSRGAWLATTLALRRPGLAQSLVAIDSNTLAPAGPQNPAGDFYRAIEREQATLADALERVRLEPDAQCYSAAAVTDDFLQRLAAIEALPKTRAAAETMVTRRELSWRPTLDALREQVWTEIEGGALADVPALIVWGADDVSAPVALAHELYGRFAPHVARCELHVFNHARHYVYRDHPDAFVAQLDAFWAASPVGAGA